MEAHGVLVVDLGGAEHRHRDGDRHVRVGPEIGLLARQRLEQPGSRDRYRGGRLAGGFHGQGGQPVGHVVTDQDVGCRVGTEAKRDGGAVAVALPRAPEGLARLAVPDRNFAGRPELERDRGLGGPGVADQIDLGAPSRVVRDPPVTGVDGVAVAAGHRDVGLDQAAQQRDQRGGIPNRVRPGTQVLHRGSEAGVVPALLHGDRWPAADDHQDHTGIQQLTESRHVGGADGVHRRHHQAAEPLAGDGDRAVSNRCFGQPLRVDHVVVELIPHQRVDDRVEHYWIFRRPRALGVVDAAGVGLGKTEPPAAPGVAPPRHQGIEHGDVGHVHPLPVDPVLPRRHVGQPAVVFPERVLEEEAGRAFALGAVHGLEERVRDGVGHARHCQLVVRQLGLPQRCRPAVHAADRLAHQHPLARDVGNTLRQLDLAVVLVAPQAVGSRPLLAPQQPVGIRRPGPPVDLLERVSGQGNAVLAAPVGELTDEALGEQVRHHVPVVAAHLFRGGASVVEQMVQVGDDVVSLEPLEFLRKAIGPGEAAG